MELYKKYRPKELEDIIGNESMLNALSVKLNGNTHAFLLTGPSGCGKTTLARIIADKLGCNMKHDYYEKDSASYRGIDDVREIRKTMMMGSLTGKGPRVWLLDECHQLSKDAQTALLKALEDTPKHVYFILATTDPQKLLPTIKTRCTTFKVNALTDKELAGLIKQVSRQEHKRIPESVVDMIVDNSLGSARMALVLLDKVIDLSADDMLKAVEQTAADENEVIELCRALMGNKPWGTVNKILRGIEQEPEGVRRMVRNYFTAVLIKSDSPRASVIIDNFYDLFYDKACLVNACYLCTK